MEDREIFARTPVVQGKGGELYITERAKKWWDKRNPRKFTPEFALKSIAYVSLGSVNAIAAEAAGASRASLQEWLRLARDPEDPKSTEELRAWKAQMDQAAAMAEARAVRGIIEAGVAGTWTAFAWYLERKHPERWGRKDTVAHTGPDGGPLSMQDLTKGKPVDTMNSEQRMQEMRELMVKCGAATADGKLAERPEPSAEPAPTATDDPGKKEGDDGSGG